MLPSFNTTRRQWTARRGFSLLEMMMAAVLVAGTVVPALSVIRDAMSQSRAMHRRVLLGNYAVRILEDQIAYAATNWTNATPSGNFASDGHDSIRYNVVRSDDPADGGVVNQLMSISVTVFDDGNANSLIDAGELQETYRTKVAKMFSYENEES